MPYIKPEFRNKFNKMIDDCPKMVSKGELEFILFKICKIYMRDIEHNYSNLHDVSYAAVHVGEEIKRRFLDSREDWAMKQNGDIE